MKTNVLTSKPIITHQQHLNSKTEEIFLQPYTFERKKTNKLQKRNT